MTHTVHPYSHRLGILRGWKSRWFSSGKRYQEYLKRDIAIREYLRKKLRGYFASTIEIERGENSLRVVVHTSRPGMIIGRQGEGTQRLKKDIAKMLHRKGLPLEEELKLDVEEIRSPETDAHIVGQMIAEGLEKRLPFRRVIKQTVEKVMANRDVQGVRVKLSGRLGGADMARKEDLKRGRIPLQTFRADIDFARERAKLPYGDIGIKVWVYRGQVFE